MEFETLIEEVNRRLQGEIIDRGRALIYHYSRHNKEDKQILSSGNDVLVYDTSLQSDNLGDDIIRFYCERELKELGVNIVHHVPTHVAPSKEDEIFLQRKCLKILEGTNIISPDLNKRVWKRPKKLSFTENLCLLGNGLACYNQQMNTYSRWFYRTMLQNDVIHSVRDSETEGKLKSIDIRNVVNTSCPTMWGLTEEHCRDIPKDKSRCVITSVTDYCENRSKDSYLIQELQKHYENVYIWLQGNKDFSYISELDVPQKVKFIKTLPQFHDIISNEDVEYIGTRLHAGIDVLNYKKRSLIVVVDDRARKIAQDTGLPVIERENLTLELTEKIREKRSTEIRLPMDNIILWRESIKQRIR